MCVFMVSAYPLAGCAARTPSWSAAGVAEFKKALPKCDVSHELK
jgi:hypothetical protein